MKTAYKFLLGIGIVLFILSSFVVVLSQIKKDTYISTLQVEATNGYPPHLIRIRDYGLTEENAFLSILPSLSIPRLSITTPLTTMNGKITLICGSGYEQTQDFNLKAYKYGEMMEQKIIFKGIPADSNCIANAVSTECVTDQSKYNLGSVYIRFET